MTAAASVLEAIANPWLLRLLSSTGRQGAARPHWLQAGYLRAKACIARYEDIIATTPPAQLAHTLADLVKADITELDSLPVTMANMARATVREWLLENASRIRRAIYEELIG